MNALTAQEHIKEKEQELNLSEENNTDHRRTGQNGDKYQSGSWGMGEV